MPAASNCSRVTTPNCRAASSPQGVGRLSGHYDGQLVPPPDRGDGRATEQRAIATIRRRMPAIPPHRRRRFAGRDPDEEHRASTPLELLYDLTIVVAFGTAADELAHYVAEEHVAAGIAGFVFATFAISWAWLGYSWFASAFDTDDWVFRLATMVQMAGVIVVALGVPQVFESIDHGDVIDNRVVV